MPRDPIVDEVRAHRAAIAQEHGNELKPSLRRSDAGTVPTVVMSSRSRLGECRKSRRDGPPDSDRRPNVGDGPRPRGEL
jgi:hypothetical protein